MEQNDPRISFIIPYYQKPRSINKCLRSLFNQSIRDQCEIIVVMDGPDAEAKHEISKHKKVKLIEIPHGGAPAARNAGLEHAQGDIVVFWDADCYIEHGAAAVWLQVFDHNPDVDFVYSGYRFQEGMGGIPSEPFDPWLLRIGNYISGCFPIRKAKAPRWDVSLKSLQDWDFWLTAVENGCKGYFVRGYAFQTDYPDPKSISGNGCIPENWLERVAAVKNKHGIPFRDTCITSVLDFPAAKRLAKLLNADAMEEPNRLPNRYKTIIQIGFNPKEANVCARNFMNPWSTEKVRKILFWQPGDVYTLRYEAAMAAGEALSTALNASLDHQFCEDEKTHKELNKLGFKVAILSLPMDTEAELITPLPAEFSVLIDSHPDYKEFFESIQRALPDIKFKEFSGTVKADDFTVMLKFWPDRCMDSNAKKMLLNGRFVVSNINEPYCNCIERQATEDNRADIIAKIRSLQSAPQDLEAAKYWREQCAPAKFLESIKLIEEKVCAIA